MKHGTDNKLKFKLLKRRLKLPLWQVKGILQSIWDFTTENAMRGDIGRYTDAQIAMGIEYDGDIHLLISTLVDEGWLDKGGSLRLVVHDWPEHCERWVKQRIERQGLGWAENDPEFQKHQKHKSKNIENIEHEGETALGGAQRHSVAHNGGIPNPNPNPNPKPNPKPHNPLSGMPPDGGGVCVFDQSIGFAQFWEQYPKGERKKGMVGAEKIYRREIRTQALHDCLLERLNTDKSSRGWTKDAGQFIPGPSAWLNAKRWMDEVAAMPVDAEIKVENGATPVKMKAFAPTPAPDRDDYQSEADYETACSAWFAARNDPDA